MGDLPGHPFRGNQWTTVGGGSFSGKLAGVQVPSLRRGEVHLVRYSEGPEHETGVGEYAHAGRVLDDLVEASSYYAKGGNLVADASGKVTSEPHRGFLTIGRASAAEAAESEAGWSNGETYSEVRGVLRKENIDAVVDVGTGEVVYRRPDAEPKAEYPTAAHDSTRGRDVPAGGVPSERMVARAVEGAALGADLLPGRNVEILGTLELRPSEGRQAMVAVPALVERYRAGQKVDPPVVNQSGEILDGHHRVASAIAAGRTRIQVVRVRERAINRRSKLANQIQKNAGTSAGVVDDPFRGFREKS